MFTLYVARDRRRPRQLCPGSTLCTEILHDVPEDAVEIVDCDDARAPRPAWVRGTPTLHASEEQRTWTGHDAILRLYALALHHAHAHAQAQTQAQQRPARPNGMQQRLPPSAQPVSARASAPPSAPDEDALPPDEMWESQIPEGVAEEPRADRKMTSDDLARAISSRLLPTNANGDTPQTLNAPPPPPPQLTD